MKTTPVALPVVAARLGDLVRARGRVPVRDVAAFLHRLGFPVERVPAVLAGAEAVVDGDDVVPCPPPSLEVIQGDALLSMRELPSASFDVVLCDPPYSSGATREAGKSRDSVDRMSRTQKGKPDQWFGGDSLSTSGMLWFLRACALEWFRLIRPGGSILVFIDWRMAEHVAGAIESADLRRCGLIVWDKMKLALGWQYRNRHELVLWFSRGVPNRGLRSDIGNVIACPSIRGGVHPTEKPVALLRSLLSVTCPPGGRVLDPFAGSGSTGEAAGARGLDHLGKERWVGANFIGIERSPKYAKITRDRLQQVTDRTRAEMERKG